MRCQYCHQPLVPNVGDLYLPPRLFEIFDTIRRAGPDGIDAEALSIRLRISRKCVHNNIKHLRDRLVETDILIEAEPYRIINRKEGDCISQPITSDRPSQGRPLRSSAPGRPI